MKVIRTIEEIRIAIAQIKKRGKTIGFVPTMGALHEGHLSLIRQSKKENDITVLSIFVNPTQFGPKEDFAQYPRVLKNDKSLAQKENVDIIFYPSVVGMYPPGEQTTIDVGEIANVLCGKFRPGHFRGVATVVGKFLNIISPDVMYLGQKDVQQVVVIKKFVDDLNFPVRIKSCTTVREENGLALSSRNQYLSSQERNEAAVLFQSLKEAKQRILKGERNAAEIKSQISQRISKQSSGKIQYIECVDHKTLKPLKRLKGRVLIVLAVYFGTTRLIDNISVSI